MRYKIILHDYASGWDEVAYASRLEEAYVIADYITLSYREDDFCEIIEIIDDFENGSRYRVAAERRDGVWRERAGAWHSLAPGSLI